MNTRNHEQTHAPSHLRKELLEWLDSYEPDRLGEAEIQSISKVLNALADCGDILPADYCDQLEIPKGSTYAQAVEKVRQLIEDVCRANEKNRPQFLGVAILARHDPNGPYSLDNCYFRTAVSEEEAREGSELHVGADLRERFLELERQGWVQLDKTMMGELMGREARATEDHEDKEGSDAKG